MLDIDDRNSTAWRYLGMNYAEQSCTTPPNMDIETKALECYRRAYSIAPSDRLVVHNLVCFLGYTGRITDAIAIVDEFARVDSDRARELKELVAEYEKRANGRGSRQDELHCCET